jgi:hypothetical protein
MTLGFFSKFQWPVYYWRKLLFWVFLVGGLILSLPERLRINHHEYMMFTYTALFKVFERTFSIVSGIYRESFSTLQRWTKKAFTRSWVYFFGCMLDKLQQILD